MADTSGRVRGPALSYEVLLERLRAERSARHGVEAKLAEALVRLATQTARAEAAEARLAELQAQAPAPAVYTTPGSSSTPGSSASRRVVDAPGATAPIPMMRKPYTRDGGDVWERYMSIAVALSRAHSEPEEFAE